MSICLYGAEASIDATNFFSGLHIVGPESAEGIVEDISDSNETITRGNFSNLMDKTTSFGFIDPEFETKETSFDPGIEGVGEETNTNLIEQGNQGETETIQSGFGEETLVLELFQNGNSITSEFINEADNLVVKGMTENSDFDYDELSNKFYGQDLEEDPFNSTDTNFDIF